MVIKISKGGIMPDLKCPDHYETEIAKHEAEIEKLKVLALKSKIHKIPADRREVAEMLHSKMCRYNHTDACGWYCDKGDWSEYSREEYLEKATKFLNLFTVEDIKKIVEIL